MHEMPVSDTCSAVYANSYYSVSMCRSQYNSLERAGGPCRHTHMQPLLL